MNPKYQRMIDAANELYAAMQDYEKDLYSRVDANATRTANAFAVTRAHIQKMLGVVPQVEPVAETQAARPEIEQSTPVRNVARKGRR